MGRGGGGGRREMAEGDTKEKAHINDQFLHLNIKVGDITHPYHKPQSALPRRPKDK